MAENFDELYDQLSKQESFPSYFQTKDDFQKFLIENEEADSVVEDLFGVKAASEYLKKKDQPIIQNLAKENSFSQSPLVGQTEEMVVEPQMGGDQNAGVVEDPLNLLPPVLPPLGYGKSFEGVPNPQKPKNPSQILISNGAYLWNDRKTGSNLHKTYGDLYRELNRLSNDPNASIGNIQTKLNQFVDVYRQLKPTSNVVEDFDTLFKILQQGQPKLDFQVDENGVKVKPKAAQAPKITFPGSQQGPFLPKTPEPPKPLPSDDAIEGYIAYYKDRTGFIDLRSSEQLLSQEVGLSKAENAIDGFLVKESDRLFKNIGGNINKFTFDRPGVVDGEVNEQFKTLYDGLYFVGDRGNISIDETFLNDQVRRSLENPLGLLNSNLLDKLKKRFDLSKEEIVDILTPRLSRLVKAKAEENLLNIQIENKVEKIAPEILSEVEETDKALFTDLKNLTEEVKRNQTIYSKELGFRTKAEIGKIEATAKSDIELKYNEYKNIVSRGAITEQQNLELYNQFLGYVNQVTTELNTAEANIYSKAKKEVDDYILKSESEVQSKIAEINKKYGVQGEEGKKTTAAQRKLKELYNRAYSEVQADARRNSDEVGWGLVDLIQSKTENVAARSIDALSAAVGYENNPFTDVLQVLNTLQQASYVPEEEFSKVIDKYGLFSMESLRATVRQIVGQSVNMVPAIAATYLTGNPWVGGGIGWAQDTVTQIGEIYKSVFEKTGSIDAAEEAAGESLKSQILLYPTYAFQMMPFAGQFLSKITGGTGVVGFFKKAAVNIAVEGLTETTQEITQQYIEYKNTTKDNPPKSIFQFAEENGLKTAIDIAPTTIVLGGFGAAMENYAEGRLETAKTEILNRLQETGMSQVVADMLQVVGTNGINIIPEYLFRGNVINQEEFFQMKSVFSEVAKTFPQIKEVIADPDRQKYFVSLTIKKKKLQESLNNTEDPNIKISMESQIKSIDKTLSALASDEKVNFSKITFKDGSSVVLSDLELAAQTTNGKFLNALADGDVTVETNNQKIQDAINKIKEQVKSQEESGIGVVQGPQAVGQTQTAATDLGVTIDNAEAFDEKIAKAQERGQANAEKIVQQARPLQILLDAVAPGAKIIFMNTEEYQQAMPLLKGNVNSRGNFYVDVKPDGTFGVEIHINLDTAQSNTLEHEVSHALIFKTLGEDPKLFAEMMSALESAAGTALGNETETIKQLIEGYRNSDKPLEFLAEASSIMARDGQRMSLTTIEKLAKIFSDLVAKLTGGRLQIYDSIRTKEGFIKYMNALADTLSTGQFSEVLNQPIQNAIQEQTAGQVSVQPETRVGEEVVQREPQSKPQGITQEGQKEEIAKIFEENNDLKSIGTEEQYSEYLNSIFPESKVKNIVFHKTSAKELEGGKFKISRLGAVYFSFYDIPSGGAIKGLVQKLIKENTIRAIVNVKNPFIINRTNAKEIEKKIGLTTQDVTKLRKNFDLTNNDAVLGFPNPLSDKGQLDNFPTISFDEKDRKDIIELAVFEPEQIHILGSKQDIEQFRKFVNNKGQTQEVTPRQVGAQPTRKKKNKVIRKPKELSPEAAARLDGVENPVENFFSSRSQLDFDEASGTTQVATTIGSYKTVAETIKKANLIGDVLDYGAGLGLGADAMSDILGRNVETLEGNDKRWKGRTSNTYKSNADINKKFDAIVSLNVLNVVEKQIRDGIVLDIFDKLNTNGKAYISARGWKGDVANAKNATPGEERNSLYIKKAKGLTFQKGFEGNELVDYIKDILGPSAQVEKNNNFGKVGVVITKLPEAFTSKSQNIFTDENGNKRDVRNIGKLAEDRIPIQANEQSLGSLGKAAINETIRIYQELGIDPFSVSSIDAGKKGQTLKDPQDSKRKLDGEKLEQWARDNDVFIENFFNLFPAERQLAANKTMESIVFLSEGSKYVYKAIQPTWSHSYLGVLRKTMAHNILFPETAYEVVGFTKIPGETQLRIILKQPAFKLDEAVLMLSRADRKSVISRMVLKAEKYGPVGVMNVARVEAIEDLVDEADFLVNDIVEMMAEKGFTAQYQESGLINFINEEEGIVIDDLHSGNIGEMYMRDPMRFDEGQDSNGNIYLDEDQNILFIDPFIDIEKTGPGSWLDKNVNPLFREFGTQSASKSQLDFTQIKPEFDALLSQPFGTPTGAFQVLIQKGYTPKRIKEALGAFDFDRYQSSFKQAQAIVATKTMNDVGTLFEGRQEQIKTEINNNLGNVEAIYDDLISQNFSPLEIFTAVRDMDFMTTSEMIDLFGAEYRQTVKTALEQENYPTDFLAELDADAKNLKVEQNAGAIADILRESGLGMVDSAIAIDVFLEYLKSNGFEQIAIQMIDAVKDFAKNKNADWNQIMTSGAIGDAMYTQEGINYAFQVSADLFSQAGRILQMARFFNEKGTQTIIEKQLALEGIVLTDKQKETLTNLVNDYKTNQAQNKKLLNDLQDDWSDQAFEAYFNSEKAVGLSTIRLAQFLDARKPGFYNERITSGGSRALLGIPTAVLSYVANTENNLLSTNYVSKSIQKLRDYIGSGIKGSTLSYSNWKMARELTKARTRFNIKMNRNYGVINNSQIERYYDNLGQVNFFKDTKWVYNFFNVWVRKTAGKPLSEMNETEIADALDLTLIKLRDDSTELRDGKNYSLARSIAWGLNPGPLGAETTGRIMAYGGDIMFGQMAAQRSMIDYFQNIQGTRFQNGLFNSMLNDANGNLDKNALRALSAIVMADSELYQKFEQEGLKRTLLSDNAISSYISKGRGKIRKRVREVYVANRLENTGAGFGAEVKRQFTKLGLEKNLLQVSDIALWTLMPFTKVPVNFMGSALAKTMPVISAPKYLYSEAVYQSKYKQFNEKYPVGKRLSSQKQKRDYELAKIDLFSAKRQATYDAAQMTTSFAIYAFAISAVKSGAILIKEDREKEDALRPAQLRSGLYNATLHREYLMRNGKNLISSAGKIFGLDIFEQKGVDNFIARRGGFAKEGDLIMNTNNFGFLGFAFNLYGSVYTQERKEENNLMVQLLDDQKNGIMSLISTSLGTGIETLPMFQGLARIGNLTNDLTNPDTQDQAWTNFISGTLSTSMAVFFPSLTSFVSKGNGEMIQGTKEIIPERENGNWNQWFGKTSINVVQKLNRNVSFSPGTRNEFYEAQIGPFGEDLSYKVTYADPGTIGAYIQAIFDPFALRSYTATSKFDKNMPTEERKYKESAALNGGLINLAMMFQQITGRDYEWKWDGKTAGMYQIITNPKPNKFVMKQDISTGGVDAPNTPNYLEYSLPNDLYRKELKERAASMRLSLRQYGEMIHEEKGIIDQVRTYAENNQMDMAQKTIVDFFTLYEKAIADANKQYDNEYVNRQRLYLTEMKKRGLISEQMMKKMIQMGFADQEGRIQ